MKKLLISLLALLFLSSSASALLIDDFNDNEIKSPEWWVFDNIKTVPSNGSLLIIGKSSDWYAGGLGTYIAKPDTDYSSFKMLSLDVYGNGPGSGTLQVEVYDDDNGNWQVEQDAKKNYECLYDDKLQYQIPITWKGWKKVEILFADFDDVNPNKGDDIFNPDQANGSGGLLQVQIIAIGSKKVGAVNFSIDNVELK